MRIAKLGILGLLLAIPVFHFASNNQQKEENHGPMFYAAEYSSDFTAEPSYSTQNSYTFNSMNMSTVYDTYRGDSVKVAVIDSGLNYDHEDFKLNGNRIIQSKSRSVEYNSGWYYYEFSNNASHLNDTFGHGTNVASVIASQINGLGCAGIAPNIKLYVYKVTNSNNGYEWTAINSALQYCIEEGIDVINMSFQAYEHEVTYGTSTMPASSGCSTAMSYYLNQCYNAGITLVAAAGNYNTNEPSYPASNNHVISVGSLAESSTTTKAGYSNTYGIDLVAPGTVYVADKGTTTAYKKTQGTSFSAPIVTAAIALYKQQNPSATPSQIESALYESCDAISGNPSWAGNGRLNLANFLNYSETDKVTSITVAEDEIELEVGDTYDIDYTVNGVGTYSDAVTFYPLEDNGTVSVDSNGRITALSEGEDYIIVESVEDSNIYASIDVNVTSPAAPVTLSSISISGQKTSYTVGDTFVKPTVTAHFSDSTSSEVTNLATCTGYDMSTAGNYTVTVSYTYGGHEETTSYQITVSNPSATTSQRIVNNSSTTYYQNGSIYPTGDGTTATCNCDGFTCTWKKNNGNDNISSNYAEMRIYASHSFMVTPNEGYVITSVVITAGSTTYATNVGGSSLTNCTKNVSGSTVTLTPTDGSLTLGFTNSAQSRIYYMVVNYQTSSTPVNKLSSITLDTTNVQKTFAIGDTFSYTGLVVTANYTVDSAKTVTPTSVSTPVMTTLGNKTVTVSYTEGNVTKQATYEITIVEGTLDSISVSGYTTSYGKNTTFSFDGTCTATLTNGYQFAVTPTSVTSPDMSTSGNKTITVSYTYNGVTRETTYEITVTNYRTVMEASTYEGTITWPSSSTASISGNVTGLATSLSNKTVYESQSIRLGTGNGGGTLTISASVAIKSVTISAKYYSSSYSSSVLKVDGQSVNNLTSGYKDYTVTLSSAKTSFTILTENSNNRINIQTVTVYATGPEVDIGQTADCIGLESFISTYMHMDYTDNLGYCKDSEHHYYSTAKTAFNSLNEHQRALFTKNTAYSLEWARLSAWASINGDSLDSNNQLASNSINRISIIDNNNYIPIVIVALVLGLTTSLVAIYHFKKKKEQ